MIDSEDMRITRSAYDSVAERYAGLVHRQLEANAYDRAILGIFAEAVRDNGNGQVTEVGCGPGRVAAHLAEAGLRVSGSDLSPEMIRLAREAYPDLEFEVGPMEQLAFEDGALDAIVAWYSIIHTPPERIPAVLTEFGRVVRPGGHVLLGFQAADDPIGVTEYDHKVAPAYRWAPATLGDVLGSNGFRVTATMMREAQPDERTPHGYLLAVRE